MQCHHCSHDNPAGAPRCVACGADLGQDKSVPAGEPAAAADDDGATPEERAIARRIAALLKEGKKVEAVKMYRAATGCDLVDAVEAIEKIQEKHGIKAPGCFGGLLALVLLAFLLVGGARAAADNEPGNSPGEAPAGQKERVPKPPPASRQPVVVTERALAIHRDAPVFDGHNDLPWQMRNHAGSSFDSADIAKPQERFHTDIPRLRKGGVGAQFFAAYVPADERHRNQAAHFALEQIDLIRRMCHRYPDTFELATTADDVERIRKQGKIAALIGVEGGHAIENSLSVLRMFHGLGVRYMTLTHSDTLDWADSATDEAKHGGLTPFGEEVIRTMNELGMLADISHVSAETMRDVLRVSKAPVIASHSSAFAIAPHPRNVPDDVLKMIAQNGGVVMVNFYSGFVVPESAKNRANMLEVMRELREKHKTPDEFDKAFAAWQKERPIEAGDVHHVVDHIEHIVKVAGIDHVGLGSDYDGITLTPAQLEDVSAYPCITQALLDRGYNEEQIRKILGGNILRALREAERVAGEMRK